MNRDDSLRQLAEAAAPWDVVVIGGGATGLGTAIDAASRGYRTVLLEQSDFAQATSSRSTKLIHGGVRYLRQGDVSLVVEALRERGLLIRNAPHLVRHREFVVPSYEWWEGPFYGIGMKVYDALARRLGIGKSRTLSRVETLKLIPTIEPKGLRGGVVYHDGQFDDSRLAIHLAQTFVNLGGTALNYFRVTGLIKSQGTVRGVQAVDVESDRAVEIPGRVVVNATGVFVDRILKLDEPEAPDVVRPSQGVHLVLDKAFLPGESAIMVPHTDDGRVLFAVPWHDKVVVGTTDTPRDAPDLEPRALEEEIDFILEHAGRYLSRDPQRSDVRSIFAGLRPLANPSTQRNTASISRDHRLIVSPSGLVTITGGKWTTYRKMAEDTMDAAASVAGLPESECRTRNLHIHGWRETVDRSDPLHGYGTDADEIRRLIASEPSLGQPLHPRLPYVRAEVVWAARAEMARKLEDVLARRTRALFLDARASLECAPVVTELLDRELGRDQAWQERQLQAYAALAQGYLPPELT